MVAAIRGTVNGTMLIAIVEGAIIAIAYFAAGVPHAILFTLLTMAFAMVPFGAWAGFRSASLLLVFEGGSAIAAASVFGFGALVVTRRSIHLGCACGKCGSLAFFDRVDRYFWGPTSFRSDRTVSRTRIASCSANGVEGMAHPKARCGRSKTLG